MWKPLAVSSFILGVTFSNIPAQAKGLQIDPPKCDINYGSAVIVDASSAIWIRAKGAHPEKFLSGMSDISNCFTITKDKTNAKYTLQAGTLSKEQFNQGANRFSHIDKIDSPRITPKGKMRYAYLEIRHAQTGQLAGRGFGRNNTAGLDFSNWNIQGPTGMALTTSDARLVTGAVVNAFFEFSLKSENFDMSGMRASAPVANGAPATSPRTINPRPSTTHSRPNVSSGQPASWASKSTLVIDASTAPSLDASLQAMLKPLTPRQQLQVMKEFFGFVAVEQCLDEETGPTARRPISRRRCYARFGPDYNEDKAQMYIAERRMDLKTPYTATSLAAGTRKYGRTRTESFIHFIKLYGSYIDGLSVREYSARVESYRGANDITRNAMRGEKLTHLQNNVVRWQRAMSVMPQYAGSKAILRQGQKDCQSWIDVTKEEIAAIQSGKTFRAPSSRKPNPGAHPCVMIKGRNGAKILDPEIRSRLKNAKTPQEVMAITLEASGVTPEQLSGK